MPSRVQIIKEIRAEYLTETGADPGRNAGEVLFDRRAEAFVAYFDGAGPTEAIRRDQTMAEYFANWWVGEQHRESGTRLRAALKALRAGAVPEPAAAEDAVYQTTLNQIEATVAAKSEPAVSPEVEAAYTVAESVEVGVTLTSRKLSTEQMVAELAALTLFVEASQETPSRRISRRCADLTKAIARRA